VDNGHPSVIEDLIPSHREGEVVVRVVELARAETGIEQTTTLQNVASVEITTAADMDRASQVVCLPHIHLILVAEQTWKVTVGSALNRPVVIVIEDLRSNTASERSRNEIGHKRPQPIWRKQDIVVQTRH
jgi:hypothetical protein